MKIPRKAFHPLAGVTASVAVFCSIAMAQGTAGEKRFALKTADGKYVTAADKGAFNLSGTAIDNRTVFTVLDANGGALADGDEVTIKYYPSPTGKPSFLQEQEKKLVRDEEPRDDSGKFKLKQQGAGFVLRTGSGKFVAYKSKEIEIADENALVLTFEEQAAPPAQ